VYRDGAGGFVKEIPEKLLTDAVEKACPPSKAQDGDGLQDDRGAC
jgi:hypothetical protein